MEKENKNEDMIHLQHAHVTQYTDQENGKSNWKVRKNITSEDLYELPGTWTEAQVFAALDFARSFELTAWNMGIDYGKVINRDVFLEEKNNLIKVINDLAEANERLSNKLGQLIGEQEE